VTVSSTPLQRAQAFIEAGELRDALNALDEAIAAQPDDEALRLRAAVNRRMKDEAFLRAAALDLERLSSPTSADYVEQSIIFEQLGDFPAAIRAMMVASDLAGGPAERNRLTEQHVRLLLTRGDTSSALELARKQPKTWRWMQWMGDIAAQAAEYNSAARYYSESLTMLADTTTADDRFADGFRARLLLARADAHRRSGQLEFADADYVSAGFMTPTDPMIPFNRGLIAWLRGDQQGALALCRAALARASEPMQDYMRRALLEPDFEAILTALESEG
jgi:tetratricopeptide (TPR) repeat protein